MLHRNQSSNAKKCAFEPSLTHLSFSQFLFTGDSVFQAFGGIIFENLQPLWTNHGGTFGDRNLSANFTDKKLATYITYVIE